MVPLLPVFPTSQFVFLCRKARQNAVAQFREMDYAHTQDVKQLNGRMSAPERKGRDVRDRSPRALLFYYYPT